MRISSAALALIAAMVLVRCGDVEGLFSTDPQRAQDPWGEEVLLGVPQNDVYWALSATREQVEERRAFGVRVTIETLKAYLATVSVDPSILDGIDEASIGGPMPGARWSPPADRGVSRRRSALIGEASFALDQSDAYYGCPLDAPERGGGTPCDAMVEAVVSQVQGKIQDHKQEVAQLVAKKFGCLEQTAVDFVEAWAQYAEDYGAQVALIYAKHELRAAGYCDVQVNARQVSYRLGVEQGWEIVIGLRAWAVQQIETCVVNVNEVAEQVQVMANSSITAFMTENAVCEDADVNRANQNLQAAEIQRRLGIQAGIIDRVKVLRTELQRAQEIANAPGGACWVPPPPPDLGGGCGDGGGCGGSSPLVVDLEGDFELETDDLTLTSERVSFDLLASGNEQRVSWIGPRGALVAIDLDGDGMITSGAELFGNSTACGPTRCFDGVAALAHYDRLDQGGNDDGLIDHRDAVFERLLLWEDRDGDALSRPDELSRAMDRGVRSIDLRPTYPNLPSVAGRVSAGLQMQTERGAKPVFDVWFRMKTGLADLSLSRFLPGD